MSLTIIPKLLNPDYDHGYEFSPKKNKISTKTPSGRISSVPLSPRLWAGTISYSPMSDADYQAFRNLWDTCQDYQYGCLFWDHNENRIVQQSLGVGDGSNALFQLHKQSSTGSYSVYRKITRPVTGYTGTEKPDGIDLSTQTVLVEVEDGLGGWTDESANCDVGDTTGIITFDGGHIPPDGRHVRATCYFFIPIWFPSPGFEDELSGNNHYIKNLMVEEVMPF